MVCDDCSGFILIARYQKRKGGWNITEEGTDLRHCCVVTDPVDGQKSYAPCTSRRTVSSAEVSRSVIFNTLAALPKDRNHSRGLPIKLLQHALVAEQLPGASANVVKKALKKVKLGGEDHLELWKQIKPYLACFQDSNPGSIAKVIVNEETNVIQDIIVIMPKFVSLFTGLRNGTCQEYPDVQSGQAVAASLYASYARCACPT